MSNLASSGVEILLGALQNPALAEPPPRLPPRRASCS
jgi:hypothetical protein